MSRAAFDAWQKRDEEERLFGVHSLFQKIFGGYNDIKELVCPRCGRKGTLMLKTTVTKKKYRYRKWYVYHALSPIPYKTSIRIQKWCYLNINQINDSLIQGKIRAIGHMRDVFRYLVRCIRIRYEEFKL